MSSFSSKNYPPLITLQECVLRPFSGDDAGLLHKIYLEDGVMRYFPNPNPPTFEKVQKFISLQQEHWDQYGYGNWAIEIQGQPGLIGWAGLQFLPELNAIEVGYLIGKAFWRHGYATAAARASTAFGFERLGLEHLIALIHPENIASLKVAQKCGFQPQKTIFLWGIMLIQHDLNVATWRVLKREMNGSST